MNFSAGVLGVLDDAKKTCPGGQVSELEQARLSLLAAIARYHRAAVTNSLSNVPVDKEVMDALDALERLLNINTVR